MRMPDSSKGEATETDEEGEEEEGEEEEEKVGTGMSEDEEGSGITSKLLKENEERGEETGKLRTLSKKVKNMLKHNCNNIQSRLCKYARTIVCGDCSVLPVKKVEMAGRILVADRRVAARGERRNHRDIRQTVQCTYYRLHEKTTRGAD